MMQIARAESGEALESDRAELGQIFQQQKGVIFRAAYRVTGSSSDAEDVLQTVFLRLSAQENFSKIGNLPAYLHRSAVNASLDLLRSRRKTTALDVENDRVCANSTLDANRSLELRDWLRHALSRLEPRWAEMFILRFVEDYSNSEIARMMGTSTAVVAVLLHRTRARLKKDYLQKTRSTS